MIESIKLFLSNRTQLTCSGVTSGTSLCTLVALKTLDILRSETLSASSKDLIRRVQQRSVVLLLTSSLFLLSGLVIRAFVFQPNTPPGLKKAVCSGDRGLVQRYLDSGCYYYRSLKGRSALDIAITSNQCGVAEDLLQRMLDDGENLFAFQWKKALKLSAKQDNEEMFALLLSKIPKPEPSALQVDKGFNDKLLSSCSYWEKFEGKYLARMLDYARVLLSLDRYKDCKKKIISAFKSIEGPYSIYKFEKTNLEKIKSFISNLESKKPLLLYIPIVIEESACHDFLKREVCLHAVGQRDRAFSLK